MQSKAIFDHLKSCTPEEREVVIAALSPAQRSQLIFDLCAKVNSAVKTVLDNADEIWENRP